MPSPDRRDGKRNRERKSKRVIDTYGWSHKGRVVVVVEITAQGLPVITTKVPFWRVDAVSREKAAAWLVELQPRLSHEEAYACLWSK